MRVCHCECQPQTQCSLNRFMIDVGSLRVMAEISSPQLVTIDQLHAILNTLGPATNQQVFTQLGDIPNSSSLPPALNVPTSAAGIQELTLIVTPDGYAPSHFSVKKNVPVRLVFRQLGEVGCGNELLFRWGAGQPAHLVLTGPDDEQTLEFIPREAGDFAFNCPHEIYRGVMTVQE
jgi:hypothetical protein